MIESAKFVIDFLKESNFRVDLNKEIKYLSECKQDGDVNFYIRNHLKVDNSSKDELIRRQDELILKIRKKFMKKYRNSLDRYSGIADVQINSVLTRSSLSIYSKNSDMMKGMLRINKVNVPSSKNLSEPLSYMPTGILLYASVLGGQYSNYWIEEDVRMVYHLKRNSNEATPNLKNGINVDTLYNKYPIHLFEKINGRTEYIYKGIFECVGLSLETEGAIELVRKDVLLQDKMDQYELLDEGYRRSRTLNVSSSDYNNVGRIHEDIRLTLSQSLTYIRDSRVVRLTLDRANGYCERCSCPAPFLRRSTKEPYLEVHHIIPLSEGGDDTIENAMALCPNCHREIHFG